MKGASLHRGGDARAQRALLRWSSTWGCARLLARTVALAPLAGCTSPGPPPALYGVSPSAAYNDQEINVDIHADGLRPGLALSTGSGMVDDVDGSISLALLATDDLGGGTQGGAPRRVLLEDLKLVSASVLRAKVPQGLPAGRYTLTLDDSREHHVVLPEAFTSLGPDLEPPTLTLVAPSVSSVYAGEEVAFRFTASDPTRPVTLNLTDNRTFERLRCTGLPCDFTRILPLVPDHQASLGYGITATAADGVGNFVTKSFPFVLLHGPVVDKLVPQSGPVAGGTSLALTGGFLPADAQVLVDGVPLLPGGGERSPDGKTLRGWTAPHAPGVVKLKLKSAIGVIDLPSFTFNTAPLIKRAVPPTLPTADCHELRLVGNHFPADAEWFIGHDADDRLAVPGATLDPSGSVATLCVGASFGAGPLSIFLDSASAGSARLHEAFAFVLPQPQNITSAPLCSCP